MAVAETGSGKTLAYALPMLHQLKELESSESMVEGAGRPRGIVLVPGRELGEQVCRVFKTLTHATRLRVRMALGGSAANVAAQNVAGKFEILVATPGRLQQLIERRKVRLDDVRMLVFDEADQLLDPGFLPFAHGLVRDCRVGVQLAMFSATMKDSLAEVVKEVFADEPVYIETAGSNMFVPTLRTDNRAVHDGKRLEILRRVLKGGTSVGTLLFANTRAQCDTVATWLGEEGIAFVRYMGEMDRKERRANLAKFREGDVSILLTTDLGGRGLDIDHVERVINVHLPQDADNYMHRVGRTARAGRDGLVVNLVTERDVPLITRLKRRQHVKR